ncbi:MAG: NUDIX domain-containing protein [Verrucomicrobia bacterium]|nr:NUDIX domain-containing protein [Verrucomicrobiota bacterium]
MKPPVSIAGAIFSSDRSSVLLIQRRDVPVWVLPGGGIDPGEKPEEAVLREILEETGFTVKIDRLVGDYSPINRLAKQTQLFECSILSGEATINSECRNIQFFPLTSLPKKIPPPYREWIFDALAQNPPLSKQLTSVNYPRFLWYLLSHPILVCRFLLARLGLSINS